MGTWGSGNLDSDGAMDTVRDRSKELTAKVWDGLRSESSTEADECEYDDLFVDLEWLLAVETAGCFNGWDLPSTAELDPVVEQWLAKWGVYFDGLAGPDFKARRRAVIVETFDKMRAVCAKYEALRA